MPGTLPVAAWRNLSSLSYLTLAFNNFSSTVPASLASALPSLRTLHIDYNCLTGADAISAVKRKRVECLGSSIVSSRSCISSCHVTWSQRHALGVMSGCVAFCVIRWTRRSCWGCCRGAAISTWFIAQGLIGSTGLDMV